ncbi:MAG: phenylacetate--CoA ligase family protein, partial [Armatimonadota bacterium]
MLTLYHNLPYPLRVLAVSARGYYLRWWRYGPETERLVEEALERETWSPERWKAWQGERLAYVLHRARHRVPYYRAYWDERERRGDRASWEYLENWPVLKKEPLRAHPHAFVADDCDVRRMFHEHTSGTTGTPLSLWIGRRALRQWYALFEARWRRWYGVSRRDRWGILGGQLVTPFEQTKPPFWVWNFALRQLYLSSYHLSPAFIPTYVDALKRHRVHYLWGYASSLYTVAASALEQGLEVPSMRVAISNAEPLYEFQREAIARAFQCPVRNTYGMSEMVAAASECERGRLHLWPEAGVVEVLANGADEALPLGQTGRLICTGLL